MTFLLYLSIIIFIIVCLLLILVILIQKGRGGGLSTAFGGGGGGNTAFGSKTGDVLTWVTSVGFGIFLLLAIGLNLLANHVHEQRLEAAGLASERQQTQREAAGQTLSNAPETVVDPGAQLPETPDAE